MTNTEVGKLAGSGYKGPHMFLSGVQDEGDGEAVKGFNQGILCVAFYFIF